MKDEEEEVEMTNTARSQHQDRPIHKCLNIFINAYLQLRVYIYDP